MIPNTKSSRRNRQDNRSRRVNQKNNRRGKEKSDNLTNKKEKDVETKIPRHPSLDGFELHKTRNGKSALSEQVSMESSTSEVISIKEEEENNSVGKDDLENVIKNELVKQNLKKST